MYVEAQGTISLSIAMVQANLAWENKTENLERLYALVSASPKADVYLLPETFSTGFTMKASLFAENETGETLLWMKNLAAEKQAAIGGSIIFSTADRFYNRFIWMNPTGEWFTYDKRHLFKLAGEEKHYTAGRSRQTIEFKGWKIALFICYDLRFPVWSRNVDNYDVAIYIANWPDRRIAHWDALLPARAIENQAYVVAVNRVGLDGHGLHHSGHSAAFNAMGEKIAACDDGAEQISVVHLNRDTLMDTRTKLSFLADRDDFKVFY